MKIPIMKVSPSWTDEAVDSMVANTSLPIPFKDKYGRVIGRVTRMWREDDTVYGWVDDLAAWADLGGSFESRDFVPGEQDG